MCQTSDIFSAVGCKTLRHPTINLRYFESNNTHFFKAPFRRFYVNLEYLELLTLEAVRLYGWNFWCTEEYKVLLIHFTMNI
jgi:hypothetical protein